MVVSRLGVGRGEGSRRTTDGGTLTAGITSGTDDGCVASHELGGGQKAEGNNGGGGEEHLEPVRWDIR